MAEQSLVPMERVEQAVRRLRGHRVMIDGDLAMLSSVLRSPGVSASASAQIGHEEEEIP